MVFISDFSSKIQIKYSILVTEWVTKFVEKGKVCVYLCYLGKGCTFAANLSKQTGMDKTQKAFAIGVDLGGTNTVFGIVDAKGNIVAQDSIKTQAYHTAEADER